MKYFLMILGLIFALFAASVAVGAVLPATQIVERSRTLEHSPDAVFAVLDDIQTYPAWSPHVPDGADIVYGARYGDGASVAWRAGETLGSLSIVQVSEPSLVRLSLEAGAEMSIVTYALGEGDPGQTIIVAQVERTYGGFPFLDRLGAKLRSGSEGRGLDTALATLDTVMAADGLTPPAE